MSTSNKLKTANDVLSGFVQSKQDAQICVSQELQPVVSSVPLSPAMSHAVVVNRQYTHEEEVALKKMINLLFVRLSSIYGRRFSSEFDAQDEKALSLSKREWVDAISGRYPLDVLEPLINMTLNEFKLTSEWVPSISAFVKKMDSLYLDSLIPSMDDAFDEACSKAHIKGKQSVEWTHPIVYWCGRSVGWLDLQGSDNRSAVQKRFEKEYDKLKFKLMNGESLAIPSQSEHYQNKTNDMLEPEDIVKLGQSQGLTQKRSAQLFYYATLPPGNLRVMLKKKAMEEAHQSGLNLVFPN